MNIEILNNEIRFIHKNYKTIFVKVEFLIKNLKNIKSTENYFTMFLLDDNSNSKLKLIIKRTANLDYKVYISSDSKIYFHTDMKFKIKNNQIICKENINTTPILEGTFSEFGNQEIDVESPIYSPDIILDEIKK